MSTTPSQSRDETPRTRRFNTASGITVSARKLRTRGDSTPAYADDTCLAAVTDMPPVHILLVTLSAQQPHLVLQPQVLPRKDKAYDAG